MGTPAQVLRVNTADNTVLQTGISSLGLSVSDLAVSPDGKSLIISEFGGGAGFLGVYDTGTFKLRNTNNLISTIGGFSGNVRFVGPDLVVVGSAGDPVVGGGELSLVSATHTAIVQQIPMRLASNLTASLKGDVFVSTGGFHGALDDRIGVD